MRGRSRLIGHFLTYMSASAINKGIPLLMLPVLTRYMAPTEFGIWALFQTLVSFSIPIISMGSEANITRNFFKVSQQQLAKLMVNLLLLLSLSFSFGLMLVALLGLFIDDLLGIPKHWLLLIPIISFANTLNQYNLILLRNKQRPLLYGLFEIGMALLNLSIALTLVVWLEQGWQGMGWANFVATVCFAGIGLAYLFHSGYLQGQFDRNESKQLLLLSLPLIPHGLGTVVINLSDRLFIAQMNGKAAVGLYASAYTIGMMVLFIKDAFAKVWSPWIYRQLAHITPAIKQKIVLSTYLYNVGILLLALLVSLVAQQLIPSLLGAQYSDAKDFVVWISLGFAFYGMYAMLFPFLINLGQTGFLSIITVVAAVFNLAANYILIKLNGPIGAAQATLLSYLLMYIGMWWRVQRSYPLPWFTKLPGNKQAIDR